MSINIDSLQRAAMVMWQKKLIGARIFNRVPQLLQSSSVTAELIGLSFT